MTSISDPHPKLGKKVLVAGPDLIVERMVQDYWPNAFQAGNFWWMGAGPEAYVVAYQFKDKGQWYMRRANNMDTVWFPPE